MADEIAWRRNWKPDFDTQPWKVINTTATDKTYLIKFYFEESLCSYKIAVTDNQNLWFESIDQTTFDSRAKQLNPKVEAQNSYLLSHLFNSLSNSTNTDTFSVKEDEVQNSQTLTLRLKSKLRAGVPFFWEFCFSLEEKQLMKEQFVLPFLSIVGELQRRQTELVKLLQKKDYELQEYKDSGAVLSRKAFETPKFDEDAFKKKMTVSEGFLGIVGNCADNVCNKETQELYKEIMIKRKLLDFKKTSAENVDEDMALETVDDTLAISNPGTSSWDAKLPPSLVGQMPSPPVKRSPQKSPKLSSPEKSPSKDVELKRREDLQKRLAEEKEKSKSRKKKKLKL